MSLTSEVALLAAENLRKVYRRGSEEIVAVRDVSFSIRSGDFAAIVGPSGAGKTTLLQLIGAMDNPTSGRLLFSGKDVSQFSDRDRTRLRRESIGFVFQHFGLLPTLTVQENIALPTLLGGAVDRKRVDYLLERVGLTHRRSHRPAELSGGEMQRVAIARALIRRPPLLLADEPTGNLDSETSAAILSLLNDLRREGLTIVVVTHNDTLAGIADYRLRMTDGSLLTND